MSFIPGRLPVIWLAAATLISSSALAVAPADAALPARAHAHTVARDSAGRVTPFRHGTIKKPLWPTGTDTRSPWPTGGQAALVPTSTAARAGSLPVSVKALKSTARPQPVTFRLWPRSAGAKLGRGEDSLVLTVTGPRASATSVDVDASAAASNLGGDWLSRTSLVVLTGCRVASSTITGCTHSRPLKMTHGAKGHLVATLPASTDSRYLATSGGTSAPTMVMATATAGSGPVGSYAASPLSSASSWSAGGQSGSFSWNQQLAVPPVPGDLTPTLGIGYDSGSVDGRVSASNNQPTWLGDGFDMDPGGYIERRYVPCSQDMSGGNNTTSTGDNCWKSDNATIAMAGHSGPLVKDKTSGAWKLYEDDGTKFVHAGTLGGTNEYWTMTTQDGTVYTFGKGTAVVGGAATNSAWTAPVFGNQSGEPCYTAGNYAASVCPSAVWRWNLDSIVDIHGNAMTFKYTKESNNYGENNNHTVVSYNRGGYLSEIDYGQRTDAPTALPVAKVLFGTAERCITDASFTNCAASNLSVDDGLALARRAVRPDLHRSHRDGGRADEWRLRQRASPVVLHPRSASPVSLPRSCPAPPTPTWTHGLSPRSSSTPATAPANCCGPRRWPAPARSAAPWPRPRRRSCPAAPRPRTVSTPSATARPPIYRFRMSWIDNGQGGTTSVGFTPQDCTASSKPADPAANTRRCFPAQYLAPNATTPTLNWFNKYLVSYVTTTDSVASQPSVTTSYQYIGSPAWHFDRDDLTPAALRTWGQWRGYGTVRTFVGTSPGPWTTQDQVFMRGMDHDCLTTACTTFKSATVTDSRGGTLTDADQDNGFQRESRQYASGTPTKDAQGTVTSSTVGATLNEELDTPLLGAVTSDDNTRQSRLRVMAASSSRTYRADATYQEVNHATTYDAYGQPTQEESATADAGTTCTRTTYANDTTHWIHNAETSRETVSVPCATTPNRATDVVSADRTLYDGATTWSATPTLTKGDATTHQAMTSWDAGTSTATYQTTASVTYDADGRTTSTSDALGKQVHHRLHPGHRWARHGADCHGRAHPHRHDDTAARSRARPDQQGQQQQRHHQRLRPARGADRYLVARPRDHRDRQPHLRVHVRHAHQRVEGECIGAAEHGQLHHHRHVLRRAAAPGRGADPVG